MCPWYVRRVPSCQTQALTHPLLSEITRAPANRLFDTSCFNGTYVTGDVDDKYFAKIQAERNMKKAVSAPPSTSVPAVSGITAKNRITAQFSSASHSK